ncbi:Murein L,D-transpeptidase YcbB/YkuD [Terriglobus roseus]|uniref:Murein L,D-transpeptidase YcbB/YkuD n=2 Tax=Terriglobus roseus TaxID=392734 RepID=A0A1H4M124_9BACT|nr:Murein L,D-transpeptidase YcbB/YkuD [Terriglobus roseus]
MRMLPKLILLGALSATSFLSGCKRAHQLAHHVASSEPDYTAQIQADVTPGKLDGMKYPDFADIQSQVASVYDTHDFDAVWIKNGKPTAQANAMLSEFSNAIKRGLRPDDYDASKWQERVANLKSPEGVAIFDVALTVNAMRFISDLHMGRANPAHFTFGIKGYDDRKIDASAILSSQVLDASDVTKALDAVEPQAAQYSQLKTALAHYLDLVPQDHSTPLPEIDSKAKVVPLTAGYPAMQSLQQKLALYGDLSTGGDANAPADINTVTDALKHFQHRHGIAEDGKLGHDVVVALNTPVTARVTQIADSMERWRWLNDDYQNAAIMVNLPEFQLRAFEGTGADHHEVFRMNVVDGASSDDTHHTPMIADQMKYLVFRPYWNVPPSIAKKEIIPHMEKQPGYLGAKNYETVDLKGQPASPDMNRIAQGTVMVRQKAGTSNSLGLVKFMFPNQFNVYLHDTNEKALFSRTRRDYSHGCVRVQDPPKLADWVLRDNPKWDADTIAEAMANGDDNKSVSLPKPIPVVIFYSTAWSDDGEIHFFKDMYGYDADLEKTLDAGRPYPQKPMKAVTEKDA